MLQEMPESLVSPFFFKSGPDACLLIHGFSGSTAEMRKLGEFLSTNGYTARGISLAGHGTSPSALIGVRAEDWIKQVNDEWQRLSSAYRRVYPIGLSMGALLAIILSKGNEKIPAAVLIAPALVLRSIRSRLIPFLKFLPLKNRYYEKKNGSDIIDFESKKEHIAYNRVPLESVLEFYRVQKMARAALKHINFPVQVIFSRSDSTVSPESAEMIESVVKSGVDRLEVVNSGHVITVDRDRELVYKSILAFLKRN